jgi:hypothetical protein
MKRIYLVVALFSLTLAACGKKPEDTTPFVPTAPASAPAVSAVLPAGHPSVDAAKMAQAPAEPPPLTQKAKVKDVIEAQQQYVYIEVEQDGKTRWLAAIKAKVKKGDTIRFDSGTQMSNLTSHALKRTFPSITLVGRVVVDNGGN